MIACMRSWCCPGRFVLCAAGLALIGCTPEPQPCPEFDAAQAAYVQVSANTTLRPFQDPAYASIAASLEALPQTCPRYGVAVQLAADLRAGIERHRLEEQRAAAAAAKRAEQEKEAIVAVRRAAKQQCLQKIEDRKTECALSCRRYGLDAYCLDGCQLRARAGRKTCDDTPQYGRRYR